MSASQPEDTKLRPNRTAVNVAVGTASTSTSHATPRHAILFFGLRGTEISFSGDPYDVQCDLAAGQSRYEQGRGLKSKVNSASLTLGSFHSRDVVHRLRPSPALESV
jgi:hypothetical protein